MEVKTTELDIKYINSLLQNILDKNHTIQQKKSILKYPERLNFACPICGDSTKVSSKKRGNLYLKNLRYVCFNDESCGCSFTSFLNRFGVQMDIEKKLEIYEYLDNHTQFKLKDEITIDTFDKLFDVSVLMDYFNDNIEHKLTNLTPLKKGGVVDHYIKSRKIQYTEDIFEGWYYFTPKWKQPVMVFLNRLGEKVLSMKIRNIVDGDNRFFKIMDYSYIYDRIYLNNELDLDEQERMSYNKLSHFFNIFKVDFTETVNLFEGYLDSLSVPNSIGMIGINTDISFLLNEDGVDLQFIFDNDETGFKKSEKMLAEGQKVFLWNKLFLDLLKKKNIYKKDTILNLKYNIKDFNKLSCKLDKPINQVYNLDEYISTDKLDKIYFLDLEDLIKMK